MSTLTFLSDNENYSLPPKAFIKGHRKLTLSEKAIFKANLNTSDDGDFDGVWVSKVTGDFDPHLVVNTHFAGFCVIGRLCRAKLRYHDLELPVGIYSSKLHDTVIGDDNAINNCTIENYHIGCRNIISNIQELLCTNHSKFGNGILMEGEEEGTRIKIEVANENGRRAILAHTSLLVSDAYLWSKYRADEKLMECFTQMCEAGFSKKCDTFGEVADDVVIKNTTLIKDAKIGSFAYIKGAFKIKNVTILSSAQEPTQIGEGVELVNGIVHPGCHIFYQAVAVRFIICRASQLKYGARLLNSVLGENSTVSCCELLNNIIYPFHEQHHNSSFLIASVIMGQSNIAAGATVGSNHNSRGADGELVAKRGFWPGLCTSFKHNSYFASFVLAAKGSYNYELFIEYPFSLVAPSKMVDAPVHITPAWFYTKNMYALMRNKYKFSRRDRRKVKTQHIECDPFAPDTICECVKAIARLQELTKRAEELNENPTQLFDERAQKKYGAIISKVPQAIEAYRQIIAVFCAQSFIDYCKAREKNFFDPKDLQGLPLYTDFSNIGGQVIATKRLQVLFSLIKNKKITSWEKVHAFYDEEEGRYVETKASYALYLTQKFFIKDFEGPQNGVTSSKSSKTAGAGKVSKKACDKVHIEPLDKVSKEVSNKIATKIEAGGKVLKKLSDIASDKNGAQSGGVALKKSKGSSCKGSIEAKSVVDLDDALLTSIKALAKEACGAEERIYESSLSSHEKDFSDFYRGITFDTDDEKVAVLGTISECDFLQELKRDTDKFITDAKRLLLGEGENG